MLLQYVGIGIGQPFSLIVGTVLFMVGLAYYAKAKGRNAA
jgi:hypothetical protein